ncbi:Acetyltransferase (GNAT) family protein [Leishmania donovani]|uniref:Acetyltransferase (GNAT) family protein n=1 Tax=Leishmania donovani TaxID=5661 RepID=A0A504XS51_LEIDO|nr:Acetyltransferase (GNAT) family protein [Leishmania donovani]
MFEGCLQLCLEFIGAQAPKDGCSSAQLSEFICEDILPYQGWAANDTLRDTIVRLLLTTHVSEFDVHAAGARDDGATSGAQRADAASSSPGSCGGRDRGKVAPAPAPNASNGNQQRRRISADEAIALLDLGRIAWAERGEVGVCDPCGMPGRQESQSCALPRRDGDRRKLLFFTPSHALRERVMGFSITNEKLEMVSSFIAENAVLGWDRLPSTPEFKARYKNHLVGSGLKWLRRVHMVAPVYMYHEPSREVIYRFFPHFALPLTEREKKRQPTWAVEDGSGSRAEASSLGDGRVPSSSREEEQLYGEWGRTSGSDGGVVLSSTASAASAPSLQQRRTCRLYYPLDHYYARKRRLEAAFPSVTFDLQLVRQLVQESPERRLLMQDAVHAILAAHGLFLTRWEDFSRTERMHLRRLMSLAGLSIVVASISLRGHLRELRLVIPSEDLVRQVSAASTSASSSAPVRPRARFRTGGYDVEEGEETRDLYPSGSERDDNDAEYGQDGDTNSRDEAALRRQLVAAHVILRADREPGRGGAAEELDLDHEGDEASQAAAPLSHPSTRHQQAEAVAVLRVEPNQPLELQAAHEAERRPLSLTAAVPRVRFHMPYKQRSKALGGFLERYAKTRGTLVTRYLLLRHTKVLTLVYAPRLPTGSPAQGPCPVEATAATVVKREEQGDPHHSGEGVAVAKAAAAPLPLPRTLHFEPSDPRLPKGLSAYSVNTVLDVLVQAAPHYAASVPRLIQSIDVSTLNRRVLPFLRHLKYVHTTAVAQRGRKHVGLVVLVPAEGETRPSTLSDTAKQGVLDAEAAAADLARRVARQPVPPSAASGKSIPSDMVLQSLPAVAEGARRSTLGERLIEVHPAATKAVNRVMAVRNGYARSLVQRMSRLHLELTFGLHDRRLIRSAQGVTNSFLSPEACDDVAYTLEPQCTVDGYTHYFMSAPPTAAASLYACMRYWIPFWSAIGRPSRRLSSQLLELESNATVAQVVALSKVLRQDPSILAAQLYQSGGLPLESRRSTSLGDVAAGTTRRGAELRGVSGRRSIFSSASLFVRERHGRADDGNSTCPTATTTASGRHVARQRPRKAPRTEISGPTVAEALDSAFHHFAPLKRVEEVIRLVLRGRSVHLSHHPLFCVPATLPAVLGGGAYNRLVSTSTMHMAVLAETLRAVRNSNATHRAPQVRHPSSIETLREEVESVYAPRAAASTAAAATTDLEGGFEVVADMLRMIVFCDQAHYRASVARSLLTALNAPWLVSRARAFLQRLPVFRRARQQNIRVPQLSLAQSPYVLPLNALRTAPRPCANMAVLHQWAQEADAVGGAVAGGRESPVMLWAHAEMNSLLALGAQESLQRTPPPALELLHQPSMDQAHMSMAMNAVREKMTRLPLPQLAWPAEAVACEGFLRRQRPDGAEGTEIGETDVVIDTVAARRDGQHRKRKRSSLVRGGNEESSGEEDKDNSSESSDDDGDSVAVTRAEEEAARQLYPARTIRNYGDPPYLQDLPIDGPPTAAEQRAVEACREELSSGAFASFSPLRQHHDSSRSRDGCSLIPYPSIFHHVDGSWHSYMWHLVVHTVYRYILRVPGIRHVDLEGRVLASGVVSQRALWAVLQFLIDHQLLLCLEEELAQPLCTPGGGVLGDPPRLRSPFQLRKRSRPDAAPSLPSSLSAPVGERDIPYRRRDDDAWLGCIRGSCCYHPTIPLEGLRLAMSPRLLDPLSPPDDSPTSCRPVALATDIRKLLGHMILRRLGGHVADRLQPHRHGFRPHRSSPTGSQTVVAPAAASRRGPGLHALLHRDKGDPPRFPQVALLEPRLLYGAGAWTNGARRNCWGAFGGFHANAAAFSSGYTGDKAAACRQRPSRLAKRPCSLWEDGAVQTGILPGAAATPYCNSMPAGAAAAGRGQLARSCRTECQAVGLELELQRRQLDELRREKLMVVAAPDSVFLPMALGAGPKTAGLAKSATPEAPTPAARIAGLRRTLDAARWDQDMQCSQVRAEPTAIMQLRRATMEDMYEMQHSNLRCLPENYNLRYYYYHLLSWPQLLYVQQDYNRNTVGYVLGKMDDEEVPDKKHGHITSLAVLRSHRKLGIASRVMRATMKEMDAEYGAHYCSLHVRKTNDAALHLYQDTLGFRCVGVEEKYYMDEEDAYHMKSFFHQANPGSYVDDHKRLIRKAAAKEISAKEREAAMAELLGLETGGKGRLLLEDPQALIEDERVLGEKAGRLFGFRDFSAYATLGGAVYPLLRCANDGVVSWGAVHGVNGSSNGSGSTRTTNSASSLPAGGDAVLTSSSLHGQGEVNTRWWPSLATATDARRRSRHGRRSWLQQLWASAPHLIPHLAHCLVKAASFALPGLRSVFPTALPGARRLLLARRSRCGGPERVTGLSFHPSYMWLAVAVEEGGADASTRVVVYDVGEGRVMCVLTHAFQTKVSWLQWRPQSRDVLAVGCCGGVLLWRLFADSSGSAAAAPWSAPKAFANADVSARALFYRARSGFTVTAGAFAHQDANTLACASVGDTRLVFLQLNEPPFQPQACGTVVVPSVDGGLGQVVFDDDDLFLLCTVCEHGSLALVRIRPSPTSASAASSVAAFQSCVVPTPAPVDCVARATGLGPSLYFMSTARLEGVLLARINPFIGVEVVSMISTGLYRGVGGCVTGLECSRRRLWIQTETNHLLVCRCGLRDGAISLIPIGVAAIEVVAMASFAGCTTGSLLAAVEDSSGDGLLEERFPEGRHHRQQGAGARNRQQNGTLPVGVLYLLRRSLEGAVIYMQARPPTWNSTHSPVAASRTMRRFAAMQYAVLGGANGLQVVGVLYLPHVLRSHRIAGVVEEASDSMPVVLTAGDSAPSASVP